MKLLSQVLAWLSDGTVDEAVVAAVDGDVRKFVWTPSGSGEELKYIDL